MVNHHLTDGKARFKNINIEDILHMILIPIYKEDPSIIENTLESLSQQNVSMIIGLALEERDVDSSIRYNDIIQKYENKFIKIIKTMHPNNLKNEVPGKGSNSNYCAHVLVDYYEHNSINLKDRFRHVMVTACDCDTIWCKNYFLYFNYLCTINNINNFDHIVYIPNVTYLKNFQSSHIVTNWMCIARLIAGHGHLHCLGYVRACVSEYHIPLKLLRRIDYWDSDLIHEDIHMYNKLAILDEKLLIFKHTLLPCDNQTPTDINSMYQSIRLLWNQSLRWNLFTYDFYYLFHQLLLNIFRIKRYENFRINSWKILIQIINNYENLVLFYICPISTNLFWLLYLYAFNSYLYNNMAYYLLNYIQPWFMIIHIIFLGAFPSFIFNTNDENTKGKSYRWKKHIIFSVGCILFSIFIVIYQGINMTIAWTQTLKSTVTHWELSSKMISTNKQL